MLNIPDTLLNEDNHLVKSWDFENTGIDILLYVMQEGAHSWFTTENSGIDATEIIWDFLKNHPK